LRSTELPRAMFQLAFDQAMLSIAAT